MSAQIDIAHIARLARLKLTEAEVAEFTPQLDRILSYIGELNEIDTDQVEPSSHASALYAIPRADVPQQGMLVEQVEQNAPAFVQDQIQVPRVVES